MVCEKQGIPLTVVHSSGYAGSVSTINSAWRNSKNIFFLFPCEQISSTC